eukprot:4430197-Amphidinium_carterae.4
MMLSAMMSHDSSQIPLSRRQLLVLDVSRAYFHPECKRKLYRQLPDEDDTPRILGRLRKTMYGTRNAAASWEDYHKEAFERSGQRQGKFSPRPYAGTNTKGWIHGDDILILGSDEFSSQLKQSFSK